MFDTREICCKSRYNQHQNELKHIWTVLFMWRITLMSLPYSKSLTRPPFHYWMLPVCSWRFIETLYNIVLGCREWIGQLTRATEIKLKDQGVRKVNVSTILSQIVDLLKTKHYRLKPIQIPTTTFCLVFVLFTFNLVCNYRL